MKLFLSTLFLSAILFPMSVSAQVACRCTVNLQGLQGTGASAQACPLSSPLSIEVLNKGGSNPFTFSASEIPLGTLPTQNPSCPGYNPPQFGTTPLQLQAADCNASYNGSFDIAYQQVFYTASISNCTSVQGRNTAPDITLKNPLPTDDPSKIIATVIRASLGIIGSLTLIAFVAGGLMWVTSAGNAERVKRGLNTMLYAGIGIAVIFTAFAVLQLLLGGLGAG